MHSRKHSSEEKRANSSLMDKSRESYQQSVGKGAFGIKEIPLHTTPKEIKPVSNCSGLFAREGGRRRVRERWLKRKVSAAVKDAVIAFCGTPSDERLWAKFAWRCGYGRLLEAVYQGEAEMAEHETEIPDCDKPKVLQTILNRYWRARK